jgi:hypothetical protein
MSMVDISKADLHAKLRLETKCHKCGEACRYIFKETVWCRTCLDIEQYPHLAHLTQEEREQLRRDAAKKEIRVSIVNTTNTGKIGF